MENESRFLVCTWCFTFNHAPFIGDAMNGFASQETTFPVVTIIVDDASTDGEQEIIRRYLADFFEEPYRTEETDHYSLFCATHKTNLNCQFVVFLLRYNHHSVNKSKFPYFAEWFDNTKYHAICEGDDYWVDPRKLQKQVVYMESNPNYSMVCCKTAFLSVRTNLFKNSSYTCNNSNKDCDLSTQKIILRGGGFISTCGVLYKARIRDNYPEYCINCHVGDYPLQIMAALKGRVRYLHDLMSVYRIDNPSSWTGVFREVNLDNKWNYIHSELKMLGGFCEDYPLYRSFFNIKIRKTLIANLPSKCFNHSLYLKYNDTFLDIITKLPIVDKAYYRIMSSIIGDVIRFLGTINYYLGICIRHTLRLFRKNA